MGLQYLRAFVSTHTNLRRASDISFHDLLAGQMLSSCEEEETKAGLRFALGARQVRNRTIAPVRRGADRRLVDSEAVIEHVRAVVVMLAVANRFACTL